MTRLYNRALRPSRIEITQFTLLMALDLTGETTQGKLGQLLAMDSTTLTRMLALSKKRRWIRIRQGDDRRRRLLSLTSSGQDKLREAMPRWSGAQERLQAVLGSDAFSRLDGALVELTAAAAR